MAWFYLRHGLYHGAGGGHNTPDRLGALHGGVATSGWLSPPMGSSEWDRVFSLYQATPEFKINNPDMDLAGFKKIFFWEYLHRVLGRLLGLFFFFPLLYFSSQRKAQLQTLLKDTPLGGLLFRRVPGPSRMVYG